MRTTRFGLATFGLTLVLAIFVGVGSLAASASEELEEPVSQGEPYEPEIKVGVSYDKICRSGYKLDVIDVDVADEDGIFGRLACVWVGMDAGPQPTSSPTPSQQPSQRVSLAPIPQPEPQQSAPRERQVPQAEPQVPQAEPQQNPPAEPVPLTPPPERPPQTQLTNVGSLTVTISGNGVQSAGNDQERAWIACYRAIKQAIAADSNHPDRNMADWWLMSRCQS